MVKKLKEFKNEFRNHYSHMNIKKITRNVVWRNVGIVNVETKKNEQKDIYAKDDPVIQSQAKSIVDQHYALPVFEFSDSVVKYLLTKADFRIKNI